MRTKNRELLADIQKTIEEYCDEYGYGPSTREIADMLGIGSSSAQRYMAELESEGRISRGRNTYESNAVSFADGTMHSVAILGAVPCGPLTEEHEYIEGYVRLPESLIGRGRFFILRASGDSMTGAGIADGDLVVVRRQAAAEVGDIVVALVDNESTLKRLAYDDRSGRYYLHPENESMDDMYVDSLSVQGVVVKIIKDPV